MRILSIGVVLTICIGGPAAAQHAGSGHHTIVTPAQVKWAAGPPSLPMGAKAAVLYGDPAKEGIFVLRLRLPKGYRIPPHSHPKPEILTVISGAFHLGTGEAGNPRSARRLPAGSFFALEPGTAHYAHVEQETVVQLSSTGPWTINYINPTDDPRRASR